MSMPAPPFFLLSIYLSLRSPSTARSVPSLTCLWHPPCAPIRLSVLYPALLCLRQKALSGI